jgi:RNA polymerase sigma-70 factor (ECF subfamily)
MATVARGEPGVEREDDRELIESARAGDSGAAEELLLRHELTVWRACRHLLPVEEDLPAAVQETFYRALKNLAHYSGEGKFSSWLVAIAVNYCRDRLRRRRLVPFTPLEARDDDDPDPIAVIASREPDPERVAMARQAAQAVGREVRALPARQREVFTLRFFAELELEHIAEALGVDVGTVKTHLHRAVHRVRRAVSEARP